MSERIKQYWDERAEQHVNAPAATTDDVHLRELEIATLVRILSQISISRPGRMLDVGCGNGYSTLEVARQLPDLSFLGIDYSEKMIDSARRQLEARPELKERVAFRVGDALELGTVCRGAVFDVVLTDRCLINLDSFERQSCAIAQIAQHTRSGGHYLAIENFVEGHESMNRLRRAVGVPEIAIRWHNLYFREPEFLHSVEPFFEEVRFHDFASSYYFATRVIYSAMCQMRDETPDYHHEIHQLAPKLPWFGDFSPIRLAVMRRRSSSH